MKLLIIPILLILTGCSSYQVAIAEYGAKGADDSLSAAQWAHCNAATAASLERRYQIYSNPNGPKAKAWRELCYGTDEEVEIQN